MEPQSPAYRSFPTGLRRDLLPATRFAAYGALINRKVRCWLWMPDVQAKSPFMTTDTDACPRSPWALVPLSWPRSPPLSVSWPGLFGGEGEQLDKAGLTLADLDLIELDEAFAAQVLACTRAMGLTGTDHEQRMNVNGSGVSLGHPVGTTGARVLATLAWGDAPLNSTATRWRRCASVTSGPRGKWPLSAHAAALTETPARLS